jgi:hypothetical protein
MAFPVAHEQAGFRRSAVTNHAHQRTVRRVTDAHATRRTVLQDALGTITSDNILRQEAANLLGAAVPVEDPTMRVGDIGAKRQFIDELAE